MYMSLQYVYDLAGKLMAVQIPVGEWNEILDKHADLKDLAPIPATKQQLTMSAFKGILTKEKGEALLKHAEQSRNEWDRN